MAPGGPVDVRLDEKLVIDDDVTVEEGDGFARKGNDALDEVVDVPRCCIWLLEDDDVAAINVADPVAQLVDEDAVVDMERFRH